MIGVTVHTGTADGGHYYAFIREQSGNSSGSGSPSTSNHHGHRDSSRRWFSFNDAEVKVFDPNHIAAECFGGEMNSRTYDQMTDKFMDLSIEKTHSAYMLFYERIDKPPSTPPSPANQNNQASPKPAQAAKTSPKPKTAAEQPTKEDGVKGTCLK